MTRTRALRWMVSAFLWVTVAPAFAAPQVPDDVAVGDIAGVVTDAETGQPLKQAVASVVPAAPGQSARADAGGRFVIRDLLPGAYLLLVEATGYAPALQPDLIVAGNRQTQVTVQLAPLPSLTEAVVVTASANRRPPGAATSVQTMSAEEIRRAPGGLGDVARLTQSLPGVATSSDQRNDIVARGGSPSENLTVVDGIEVASLNHFAAQGTSGGPISMLNTDVIQSATLLAGGFPAVYGDRLSSVLDIQLREGSREHAQGSVDIGLDGAAGILEGPIGSHGSFWVAAARSYLDLLKGAFGLTAVPNFSSVQGKLVYDLTPRQRLSVINIAGLDDISLTVDRADLDDPTLQSLRSSGWRQTTGVSLRSLLGDRGVGTGAIAQGTAAYDQEARDAQIGDAVIFRQHSRETMWTGQYDLSLRIARGLSLRAGGQLRHYGGRLDLAQPVGLENPYSVSETRVDARGVDARPSASQVSGYVDVTRTLARRVDVTVGTRAARYAFLAAGTFEPRAGAVVHATARCDLTSAFGRFAQAPAQVFLLAAPGNSALAPMRATHLVGGVDCRPTSAVRVTVEAYRKTYRDYPVSREYPQLSLANTGDFYGPVGLLMPLVSAGRGTVHGLEFFLQSRSTAHVYGQVAYSYSRARQVARDGVSRPGAFDTPHVLGVVAGYRVNAGFEFSTKLSLASGRPTTPFLEGPSAVQNRGILDLTRVNGARLPAYNRWDLRADKRFHGFTTVTLWAELENVLGRDNVYQDVWNPKTRAAGHVYQIGAYPVGGVTLQF